MPRLPLFLLATVALLLAACDSSEPAPPPPPPPPPPTVTPPTFSIASIPVTLADGSAGLQFAATPSVSVTLTEAVITNPINQVQRFNAQNVVVLAGQTTPLQDAGIGYTRISGTWTFRFIGARSPAVPDGQFDVTTTINVGAFGPDAPVD